MKITIGDLNYYFFFPFAKISFSQPKNQSFFQRLSNANGVDKKLYKKIANWLEKDMCLSDIKEGHKLSFLDKDFNTEKPGAPLTIAMKGGGGFQLIIILECPSNGFQTKRSLIEIVTLIKTLDKYERKHFADYALLAPFGILESSDTILKEFHDGKNSAYCILSK